MEQQSTLPNRAPAPAVTTVSHVSLRLGQVVKRLDTGARVTVVEALPYGIENPIVFYRITYPNGDMGLVPAMQLQTIL